MSDKITFRNWLANLGKGLRHAIYSVGRCLNPKHKMPPVMREPNIKTVSINDTIDILGYKIQGYKALRNAVGAYSTPGTTRTNDKGIEVIYLEPYISTEDPKVRITGLHILEIYERYPCFDSHDYAYENRYCRAFFFSKKPFTKKRITRFACMKHVFYYQTTPEWAVPAVYHFGDGDEMTIAY